MKNPPAFPLHPGTLPEWTSAGMTLRDWFAGQALAGICALPMDPDSWTGWEDVARCMYLAADAMLAERAKQEGGQ